jgi:hypothetical protein
MSTLSGKRLSSPAPPAASAAAVAFIAGPESSYITGSNLTVGGGMNVFKRLDCAKCDDDQHAVHIKRRKVSDG